MSSIIATHDGTQVPVVSNGAHLNGHASGYGYPDAAALSIPASLSPQHRDLIEASAITPEVIAARGYATIANPQVLLALGFAKSQLNAPALLIPVMSVGGESAGYQIRPDVPRVVHGKPLKYETPKGARMVLDVPPAAREQLQNPHVPLYITEGIRKADAAVSHGLCCIALLGVWNWRGTNEQGGKTALACWHQIALNGREVFIVFDSDVSRKSEVRRAQAELWAFLESKGARVRVVYLPDGPSGEKTGFDDFFARGGTVQVLSTHASDALRAGDKEQRKAEKLKADLERLHATGLPVVETNNRQMSETLRELAGALARCNETTTRLFHGSEGLVCIAADKDAAPVLQKVNREFLQSRAAVAALWISTSEREGVRNVTPPRDLCADYLADSHLWQNVPPIDGIVTAPTVAPDGSICDQNGYSAAARLWVALPPGFTMPDTTPTPANVEAAKVLLLDRLFGEVAFADAASKAHAIALTILPFVRRLIDGPTPLHLFDAPTQSSGKSYAAKICIAPFCEPEASSEKGDDEEWRKSLIAALLGGRSHIFLDNIKGRLTSPMLAAAITEPRLRERAMGGLGEVSVTVRCVWVGTSNNAQLDRDTASRCVVIRLDTGLENPEGRKYSGNPLDLIKRNRAAAIGAILTLVRHWQAQGCPKYFGPQQSRFSDWQSVIGGILQAAEIGGFLENLDTYRSTLNPEAAAWCEFVSAWHEEHGEKYVTASKLLPLALENSEIAVTLGERENNHLKRLGKQLSDQRDKVFAGFKIVAGSRIREGATYKLAYVAYVACVVPSTREGQKKIII